MVQAKTHQPCPDCGSSDALQVNKSGSTFCHSCNTFTPANKKKDKEQFQLKDSANEKPKQPFSEVSNIIATGEYKAIPERGITSATAKTYSTLYTQEKTYFGYYEPGNDTVPVSAKIRYPDKRFPIVGEWDKAGLFGQQLFAQGGKYVTIVEGEFDALAAYQMTGSKYPVVSIKNGAGSAVKDCLAHYDWLDSFETIVICFDADEPGQKAALEVADKFSHKAKIMKHHKGFKDACDYLKAGKTQEFNQAWWKAEKFVPSGIINGIELWEEIKKPVVVADLLFPFKSINDKTYGIRKGEILSIGAGSGVGKTHFVKELVYEALKTTEGNIGLLCLEEGAPVTGRAMVSLAANKPLHLPDVEVTVEEKKEAFDETLGTGRFYLFHHFGSAHIETIMSRIRHMIKALGCDTILLDHISIVVSAQIEKDERKAIDELMTRLRMLVEETDIRMILVSHLNRPSTGKPHEEGGQTSLVQFRGSGSIAHLSDTVLGLERNGQSDDPIERNTTLPRVLKNRFAGLTGACTGVYYDTETGRMSETIEEAL